MAKKRKSGEREKSIGRPSDPDGENSMDSGAEAVRGINGDNHKPSRGGSDKPASEPLKDRGDEHVSGYGGAGGTPKTSSDQR